LKEFKIFTYKASGVDTKKSSKLVKKLETITKKNFRKEVILNPGGFCSIFDLKKLKYKDPILLSSTDGVGTKLKLALEQKNLKYLGFDLVAMSVNDILANGGEPLFFLDYISSSKIKDKIFFDLIKSINDACTEAGCSLVGGETAEMPGMYKNEEFDIAGFAVGAVERENKIGKEKVKKKSLILGLESNGFHSNGFSLIRKIINDKKISLKRKPPFKSNFNFLGEDLIQPTKIYVKSILPLIKKKKIFAISHITGGGIYENLERIIPSGMSALINCPNFIIPDRFVWLKELANIKTKEMLKTFNCGIGLVIIIHHKNKKAVQNFFKKNKINSHVIGEVVSKKSVGKVIIKNFGKWDLI
jgi:phosphoribosylaminoimidazole synthetase